MPIIQFDTLDYFEKLKGAGAPEELAKIQANALRDFSQSMDEKNRQQLATKGDLRDARNELQNKIQGVQVNLQKQINALNSYPRDKIEASQAEWIREIHASYSELLRLLRCMRKWEIIIGCAMIGMMAKGFGWLGF